MVAKKVAIFTWYNEDRNCGQTLQAYALQKAIEREVSDTSTIIITYRNDVRKRIYRNWILYPLRRWLRMDSRMRKRQKKFDTFIAEYMKVSKPFYRKSQILNYLRKENILNLVVGSDQVWNPQRKLDDVYLLNFGNGFHKMSYASSMMSPDLEMKYRNELIKASRYLDDFEFISVREKSAAIMLKKYVHKRITNVLDPVFLLNRAEWEKIEKDPGMAGKKYILVYCLGETERCKNVVEKIEQRMENDIQILYMDVDQKMKSRIIGIEFLILVRLNLYGW